jgi:hypothetical protein
VINTLYIESIFIGIHQDTKENSMKTSEILRKLADMIDARQSIQQPGEMDVEIADCDSDELAQKPEDVFIPPLQLKLELLKKATGVENVYDDSEAEESEEELPHSYDELDHIKRNAGINTVVLDALGDDEPLDV